MEDGFGIAVDGFDLNEHALRASVARSSRICCYNIFDQREDLRERYDTILLFDVLEHIEETTPFLDALVFHLKPGGQVIIDVPADQSVYSTYDEAVGHVRRYSAKELGSELQTSDLSVEKWTYWGLPLIPLLHIRKRLLRDWLNKDEILQSGFKPPSVLGNAFLAALSKMEVLPQQWKGSSLMTVARKAK